MGFEYQLLDNALNPDARRGATHQAGALYDMAAASKDMTMPVGEWNHSRLVLKGEHVEHWMNGVKVVDFSLDAPSVAQGSGARWGVRLADLRNAGQAPSPGLPHLAPESRNGSVVQEPQAPPTGIAAGRRPRFRRGKAIKAAP